MECAFVHAECKHPSCDLAWCMQTDAIEPLLVPAISYVRGEDQLGGNARADRRFGAAVRVG